MKKINIKIIGFFIFISMIAFLGKLYSQEKSELVKISVTSISNPVFYQDKEKKGVFRGEIFYITKSGTFETPVARAQISGIDLELDLPVNLTVLALDDIPDEYKDLSRLWGFTVKWDGLDAQKFPVSPGKYRFIISVKIMKKIIETKKDESGNEIEVEKIIESEEATSAYFIVESET